MVHFLKRNEAWRSFVWANLSMTLLLKSDSPWMSSFSIESIARAFNLCYPIVFCVNVFILFRVEKFLSDSVLVIGVVIMICRSVTVSDKAS